MSAATIEAVPVQKSQVWPWTAIAGGAAAVLGAFLPWASATTVFGSISVNGVEGGRDGLYTAVLGAVVCILALIYRQRRSTGTASALGLCSTLILLVGLWDTIRLQDSISNVDSQYVHVSIGSGLLLTIAAGVTGIVAAFLHGRVRASG
jgi:hypothetical protein